MPDVSVRTAWEVLLPAGTQLIAGEAGLERPVTWPVVLRTHPPAFDPLRGGEIAIVPLDRLHLLDSSLTLARVVTQLARMRIGAVCAIGPVGDDAGAAAISVGVPLFRLPDGANAAEVHQAFMRSLAEHRVELANRIGEIARELTALAIDGRGRQAIVRRAGQLADAVAVLEDESGRPGFVYVPPGARIDRAEANRLIERLHEQPGVDLEGLADAQTSTGRSTVARLTGGLAEQSASAIAPAAGSGPLAPPIQRFRFGDRTAALAASLRGRFRSAGRLILLTVGRDVSALDAAILEHAAAACTIDLAQEEVATAARDEVIGDFLDELLRGTFPSEDAIERRGRSLGHDLCAPHVALAFDLRAGGAANERVETIRRGTVHGPPPSPERLIELLAEAEPDLARVIVHPRGGALIALVPVPPSDPTTDDQSDGRGIASRVRATVAEALPADFVLSIGIGGVAAGAAAIAAAAERAGQALLIGTRLFGPGGTTDFDELGLYRLLFGLRGLPEVLKFHREMLGGLIEHDRRTGGELLRTLDAYLSVGCSPTAAAEKLHLHRNGLLYRLQRIREIVPVNLDDPERRLALHLALRVGEVVEPIATEMQRIA